MADVLEGKKEIYVDPQYLSQDPQDLPPEYDEDEEVDYTIDDYDATNTILDDLGLKNYEDLDYQLVQPEMTTNKKIMYLSKIKNNAKYRQNQLKGYKSHVTKKFKEGKISEADRQVENKRIDDSRAVSREYMQHINDEVETIKGSGIKGRRKQRGGNVVFFNDVKQLLKKLELIIGEVIAGNTSIKMRNMGVNILDTLLRMSTINRKQYNQLYNQYFNV